jgi:hypothetical protein
LQQRVQQQPVLEQPVLEHCVSPQQNSANKVSCCSRTAADGVKKQLCEYWEVWETALDGVMLLFLQLFEPPEGVLSKTKPKKWIVIAPRILPILTRAAFVSLL